MDVLMLTNLLPAARRSGGEIVTQSVVDALFAAGRDVRVLGYRRPDDRAEDGRGERCVGRRPIETRDAGVRGLAWGARAVATRAPYVTTKWRSRAYLSEVRDALREGARAAIIDHAGMHSVAGPLLRARTPAAFLAHNAEGSMYESLAAAARSRAGRLVYAREARRIRAVEAELTRAARQVWALTAADAAYFRALHADADVRLLEIASAVAEPPPATDPGCDVGLIGTWTWHANGHGLRWFADEVLPLIGDLEVEVAGRGAEWLDGRHPNVRVRGVVPDAARFMAAARVVAVPSTAGGGVQVKTLDAVACGRPVVVTPVATRGLDGLPGSVSVTGDPREFADALRRGARGAGLDGQRDEAIRWSRTRRERLAADVVAWTAELS